MTSVRYRHLEKNGEPILLSGYTVPLIRIRRRYRMHDRDRDTPNTVELLKTPDMLHMETMLQIQKEDHLTFLIRRCREQVNCRVFLGDDMHSVIAICDTLRVPYKRILQNTTIVVGCHQFAAANRSFPKSQWQETCGCKQKKPAWWYNGEHEDNNYDDTVCFRKCTRQLMRAVLVNPVRRARPRRNLRYEDAAVFFAAVE